MGEKEGGGTSLGVDVGKEIDAALGDVVRGLLKKPAEEVGNLVADGIGLFSDMVRRKREINAQLGIGEVRKKLEAKRIDTKDITPPKEEELHLLMNGISLTDDENVRDMWSGLFAKVLEPDSGVTAERSFIGVIDSLSPVDAKIIHFLAHATKQLDELQKAEKWGGPFFYAETDPDVKRELELRSEVVAEIEVLASEYSLAPPENENWHDNLMRQGVIEIPPEHTPYWGGAEINSIDDEEVEKAFQEITDKVREIERAAENGESKPKNLYYVLNYGIIGPQFKFRVQLSSFGKQLAESCGLL